MKDGGTRREQMENNDEFITFMCGACKQEIEATRDMAGIEAECPGCGARIVVPSPEQKQEQKRKTIRIDLGDLLNDM